MTPEECKMMADIIAAKDRDIQELCAWINYLRAGEEELKLIDEVLERHKFMRTKDE
jgi:hypothetical protein